MITTIARDSDLHVPRNGAGARHQPPRSQIRSFRLNAIPAETCRGIVGVHRMIKRIDRDDECYDQRYLLPNQSVTHHHQPKTQGDMRVHACFRPVDIVHELKDVRWMTIRHGFRLAEQAPLPALSLDLQIRGGDSSPVAPHPCPSLPRAP